MQKSAWEERIKGKAKAGGSGAVPAFSSRSSSSQARAPSKQMVFRVVSFGKRASSAKSMMDYITQGSEHLLEPATLTDEEGHQYRPEQIDELAKSWNLTPDADNLTALGRARPFGDDSPLKEADLFRQRQVGHAIISFPKGVSLTDAQMLDVRDHALAALSERGVRFASAIHRGTDHPHMHIIFRTRDAAGRSVRLTPRDLDTMRERAAQAARSWGAEVEASRRPDREQIRLGNKEAYRDAARLSSLARKARRDYDSAPKSRRRALRARIDELETARAAVLATRRPEPAHDRNTRMFDDQKHRIIQAHRAELASVQAKLAAGPRTIGDQRALQARVTALETSIAKIENSLAINPRSTLARRAPLWYSRHAAMHQARRAGLNPARVQGAQAPSLGLDRFTEAAGIKLPATVRDTFARYYFDGDQALTRYLEMKCENPRLADWYLTNRPEIFGNFAPGKGKLRPPLTVTPDQRLAGRAYVERIDPPAHRAERTRIAARLEETFDKMIQAVDTPPRPRQEPHGPEATKLDPTRAPSPTGDHIKDAAKRQAQAQAQKITKALKPSITKIFER